jgi:hypothetical protein
LLTFFSGASAFPLAILAYKDKLYRAIILHIASHKCENWFLTWREEHMLMVLKDRVLRKIYGPKKKVRGKRRRLHSEELHDLYLYQYSGNQIKKNEKGMACGMYRGEELCIQGYGGETDRKRPPGRMGVDGKIIQNWMFKKWNWEHIDWIDLAADTDM